MSRPKLNSGNRGGPRVKIKELALPGWTRCLPNHSHITVKDLAEHNSVCLVTINNKIGKLLPEKDSQAYAVCGIMRRAWTLGTLRKFINTDPEDNSEN